MKSRGIWTDPNNVSYLEIQAYAIIETETQAFQEAQAKKEAKEKDRKNGNKSNIRGKIPGKGR
jgi:hypothetical protein